jgi:integrase
MPAHLRGFYKDKLDGGLSGAAVQKIHVVLHKALKQTVMDGVIRRNATEAVKPPRPAKREMRPLNPEETRRLLEAAHGDRFEPSKCWP